MVAGEDQHIIRVVLLDEGHVLVDGVSRAAIPLAHLALLVGRKDKHAAVGQVKVPGRAGANVGVQLKGLILGQDAHGIDAAVGAVGQREIDDAILAAIGHGRLGHVLGQDAQTAALAACQKHGNTSLLSHHGGTRSLKM